MATRAHIAFYDEETQPLDRPSILLYRHSDGFPSAVLPDIVPFLLWFDASRGLGDREYAAARLLQHLCNRYDGARCATAAAAGSLPDESPFTGTLGYGICPNGQLHGDIEFLYAITLNRHLSVYSRSVEGDDEAPAFAYLGGIDLAGSRPLAERDLFLIGLGFAEKARGTEPSDFMLPSSGTRQAPVPMETPPIPEVRAEKLGRIAELNDLFRRTFLPSLGRVVITSGVQSLGELHADEAVAAVRGFSDFTPGNDPHGEHDFGSVTLTDGTKVFWKIDYYDPTLTFGSDDPSDTLKTTRVLTIMLADEY